MSYISVNFIYFLIVFLLLYSIMKNQSWKLSILLAGNLFFYYMAGKENVLIILFSALLVFCGAVWIDRIYAGYRQIAGDMTPPERLKLFAEYKRRTRRIVGGIVILLLAVFAYVKLGRFWGWQEISLAEFSFDKSVIVPLGLSYYTLSLVGYLLDVYHDRISCEKNIFYFVSCVTFFPHIIQGPISKYDKLLAQLRALPPFDYESLCYGLQLMLWGYLKKLVLADTLALYTVQILPYWWAYTKGYVLVAVVLYAIQLYADFSGCIDIVTGISQAMGIRLDKNFDHPFFSRSAGEFWRRWHISLGVWFKEYIYMPIATAGWFKNMTKKVRKKHGRQWGVVLSVAVPSFAVWILTGIWHGTGLDYILWGLYWGVLIISSEILKDKFSAWKSLLHIREDARWYEIFTMVRTFCFYCVGLAIIIPGSFKNASADVTRSMQDNVVIVAGVFSFFVIELVLECLHRRGLSLRRYIAEKNIVIRWAFYFGAIFVLLYLGKIGAGYNADAFIYAGF